MGRRREGFYIGQRGWHLHGHSSKWSPATGKITVIDGKVTYESNFSAGDVILMEEQGKQFIKMVNPKGSAELYRVK